MTEHDAHDLCPACNYPRVWVPENNNIGLAGHWMHLRGNWRTVRCPANNIAAADITIERDASG